MENSVQLANRFRDVLIDGKWIANTNCQIQLSDVTFEQAVQNIENLNTIYALTFHINYYVAGLLNVFEGGNLEIKDKFSFEYQKPTSPQDWDDLRKELTSNALKFANHVEHMSKEKLSDSFDNEEYGSYHRNINAIIEHSYYHLGQISLIKKMLINKQV